MMYYVVLGLLCMGALFYYDSTAKWKRVQEKSVYILFSLLLVCIAGFRYGLETDYWSYYQAFVSNVDAGGRSGFEIGYDLLMRVCRKLVGATNYNGFVLLVAIISVGLKTVYFGRHKNALFALYVYYALMFIVLDLNGIRQGLAVTFLYFAVDEAIEHRPFRFFALVLVAAAFHISSLLFLPVYIIVHKKISIKWIAALIVLALAAKFVAIPVLSYIFERISVPFFTGYVGRIRHYLSMGTTRVITVGFFRRLVILCIFVYLIGKREFENPYFNVYLVGVLFYTAFMGNSVLSGRLALSFEAFIAPLAATLKIKHTWQNIFLLAAFMLLCALLLFVSLGHSDTAIPYQTWLWRT